jgi:hypothetical protein
VRVPTSVLLAVLAAAGLLALAPALVRRYDATERLVAERALSTARVIDRRRRQRTVPGRRPVNPPGFFIALAAPALSLEGLPPVPAALVSTAPVQGAPVQGAPVQGAPVQGAPVQGGGRASRASSRVRRSAVDRPGRSAVDRPRLSAVGRPRRPATARRHTPAIYRRRRVLLALVLLNLSELCGVGLLGPGFWIGSAPSLLLLAAYLVHLRNRALAERRRRREAARLVARLAARQAQVRLEQARRREALRRAAAARAAAQRESVQLTQRYVNRSGRRSVRGRASDSRAAGY